MRISDWSSDVCSSDLAECGDRATGICSRGVSRARDALAAAFRPPRGHGSTLDDVEIAGARAVALSPRSDFRDPAERGRPRVAAPFPAAPSLRRTLNPGVPLPAPVSAPRTPDTEGAAALHRPVLPSPDADQAVDPISLPLAGKTSNAAHLVSTRGPPQRP